MKQLTVKGKRFFRIMRNIFVSIFLAGVGLSVASPALAQGARAQINKAVIEKAGKDIDGLGKKSGWRDYRYKLDIFIPTSVTALAECGSALKVSGGPGSVNKLRRFNYDVACGGSRGWHIDVAVRPEIYVPVVMVNDEVRRGEVLHAQQLVLKKYNICNQRGDFFVDTDEVAGMMSRKTLRPGKPVMASQLDLPLLVQRDEAVTIVSRMEGVTAQAEGIAMKKGHKGEVIKVRNTSSDRIISAVVEDAGRVKTLNSD